VDDKPQKMIETKKNGGFCSSVQKAESEHGLSTFIFFSGRVQRSQQNTDMRD
jgi:hypothetical protein